MEGSPLRKARWESGGWTTRMSITTCTKKPHTDPRVLAMASESDTNLMFAAKKNKQTKQNNLDKTRGAGASVSITALHERDDPVHGLVCFWRGGGTSYTVLRYVIYQTTVNTVTSRAKTGESRHQTDARTQLKENTLEKPEKEAGKITHRPPQKTHKKQPSKE